MEKILKIQSEQGFTETSTAAAGVQTFINSKLVDLVIPGSGTYDLSKSYININMNVISKKPTGDDIEGYVQATDEAAMYNNNLRFTSSTIAQSLHRACPCSMLVRNASMFSANRGMVESIRRVNVLRDTLWNIENDIEMQHDGLDTFGGVDGRRGTGNKTSHMLQIMGSNVSPAGITDLSIRAQDLARDYRIPLSDLFGVGNAQWNGDVFGDTRVHLELMPNQLNIDQIGGAEDTTIFDPTGQNLPYGAMTDIANLPQNERIGSATHPLVTQITYKDFQMDMPFYVGQAINVSLKVGGAAAVNTNQIITSIEYNEGTNANNPPAGTEFVRILTRGGYVGAAAGGDAITEILCKALLSDVAESVIRINRAEIVLSEMVDEVGPSSIDYTTYSTEETQGNDQQIFNKQIICEPNAQNLIVCNLATNNLATDRAWTSYRMAINNVDVCGNRDVVYNSPLHKDRLLRTLKNRGDPVMNTTLHAYSYQPQEGTANQKPLHPILETLPLTQIQKLVNLEITQGDGGAGNGAQDVVFFKQINRTI